AEFRDGGSGGAMAPGVGGNETALGEDDLDAPVLGFAYAVWRRHPKVVLATAADCHVAARHTQLLESGCDRIGAPLGEPLVVAGRAGGIGETGNLEPDGTASFVLIGCQLDDLHALRRDVVFIPIEEHEVDLLLCRRRCRRQWRWGR